MAWVEALHIISVVAWFSGLFYLPRLFVYHAMSQDQISKDRFVIMEGKLLKVITTPAAISTVIMGAWLVSFNPEYFLNSLWFQLKLLLVAILLAYHFMCWRITRAFRANINQHSHVFYRFFNEFPVLLLIAIVILVVVKPF